MNFKGRFFAVASAIALMASAVVFMDAPVALATPTIPDDSVCSLPDVILGTEGDDTLTGTPGDDIICGLGGNDTIDGLGGNDIIIGGTGLDTLIGGEGDDSISGGVGDDYINGSLGNDSIWGGAGDDAVIGDAGADYLSGGPGADNLFGGDGIDALLAGSGNDSLNGGAGADTLNGESGVDICQKQSIDHVTSCFYDNAGPKISNIAIDPADTSLDSTDATRKLHLRFTVTDPGTGLSWLVMKFAETKYFAAARHNHQLYFDNSFSGFDVNLSYGNAEFACGTDPDVVGVCLLGGTATKGVYRATVELPRNLKTTRYYLSYYAANDQVSNQTSWDAVDLSSRHLAVSFAQTGHNDIVGPSISNVTIIGTRRIPTQQSTVIAEATYADASGNGLGDLTLNYKLVHPTADQTVSILGHGVNAYTTPCTDDYTAIVDACLVEGDKFAGRVRLRMSPSGWGVSGSGTLLRGNLKLRTIDAQDLVGNTHSYKNIKPRVVAETVVSESFGTVADNDHSAPVLLSYSASRSHIDTGGGPQTVDFTFIAKDTGKGIDTSFSWLGLMRPVACNGGGGSGCGTSVDYCSGYSTKALSGGRVRFVTRCNFPAHYPAGTFSVMIELRDKSSNANFSQYSGSDLAVYGSGTTLVNG